METLFSYFKNDTQVSIPFGALRYQRKHEKMRSSREKQSVLSTEILEK